MPDARAILPLALLLAGPATDLAPAVAGAAGAWTTYQRAQQYTDVLVRGDTVWLASSEAALQRFPRATGAFEVSGPADTAAANAHTIAVVADCRLGIPPPSQRVRTTREQVLLPGGNPREVLPPSRAKRLRSPARTAH